MERVSRNAVDELDSKEVILIFPSQRKNNKTVKVLKTPKTDTSERKVYIPKFVAQILVDIKKEQRIHDGHSVSSYIPSLTQQDHLIYILACLYDLLTA